jgi:hypothetical protein
MSDTSTYWFRAKRYGWGWGLPATWQGWTVLAGWLVALAAARHWLVPDHRTAFHAVVGALVMLLLLICYVKGEPAGWRRGEE